MAIPDVVGMAETAELLGISRTNFNQHRNRYKDREGGGFPDPIVDLQCGPIWLRKDIDAWSKKYRKNKADAAAAKIKRDKEAAADKIKREKEAAAAAKAKAAAKVVTPKAVVVKKAAPKVVAPVNSFLAEQVKKAPKSFAKK